MENSKILIAAIEQLQLAHQRVMKTNEEIVQFNSKMIAATSEVISTNELPTHFKLSLSEIQAELEKIEKVVFYLTKQNQKLIKQVEDIYI